MTPFGIMLVVSRLTLDNNLVKKLIMEEDNSLL